MSYEYYKGLIHGKLEILAGLNPELNKHLIILSVDFAEMCKELESEQEAPVASVIEDITEEQEISEKTEPAKQKRKKKMDSESLHLIIPDYGTVKTIREAISLLSENNGVSEKQLRAHILMSISTWNKVVDGQSVYESTRKKFVENFGIPEKMIPIKTALDNLKRRSGEEPDSSKEKNKDWLQEQINDNNNRRPSHWDN